ncbi:MAG: hypothetical protein JNM39_00340 [Bdellovibrionaceae bacterium]|nr:hypothetical protein [Pseudobdellovibrionaceae bacterium]
MKKVYKRTKDIHKDVMCILIGSYSQVANVLHYPKMMNHKILLPISILLLSINSFGDSKNHKYQDADYKNAICTLLKGTTEVKIKDHGRADCVTDKYAAEIEFVDLWEQGIKQAERYAKGSQKEALLALVAESDSENTDAKNVKAKLNETNPKTDVRIFTVDELKDFLPKHQVCTKLSKKGRKCHLVNTGAYAATENFEPFDSYRDCIEAGGEKPENVGVERLFKNANKAFKDGICKNSDLGDI